MPASQSLIQVDLLTDLKALPIAKDAKIFMVGKDSIDDGKGGFYRWDEGSTLAEDLSSLTVITSNVMSGGRWIRVFQRQQNLPQGTLVKNGDIKTLYVSTVTDANGEAKIFLTTDNTATGPSIFNDVLVNASYFRGDAANIANAVQSYVKISPTTTSLKSTTHGYYKANAVTLVLGALYSPFTSVGANVPVVFEIVGV